MPYPESEYPSIIRGKDKRESQRLLAAAPEMLAALKMFVEFVKGVEDGEQFLKNTSLACKCCDSFPVDMKCVCCAAQFAIAKAEGRE